MPEKWAQHNGASDRALGLYALLLFSKRQYSLTQLSKIFNCSKQTMLRHLKQIESRTEIELKQKFINNQKYVQVIAPSKPANITVDSDSLEYLSLCRDIVSHLLPAEVHQEIAQTLSLASYVLSPEDRPAPGTSHIAGAFTKGALDYSPHQHIIENILLAIRGTRWVVCDYKSATTHINTSFKVRPIKLVSYREGLYLLYNDEADDSPRMMPIQRIDSLILQDEHFNSDMLSKIDIPGTFGVMSGDGFQVKARVTEGASTYVRERTWSQDQSITELEDGGIVIEFTSTSVPETIAWVMGFGGEVELISPIALRKEIQVRLETMLKGYKNLKINSEG